MENKKLVKILLKDMAELEELIAEMRSERHYDALVMEFIHTRARGVLQLLQLLETSDEITPSPEIREEKEKDKEVMVKEQNYEGDDQKDNEMLGEEQEKTEANSRLGDSFLKGKSVNDLITDQQKLEFKLSNRPVSSIQAAIGINDRFQYIRELFDGDSERFLGAVKTLDSMQNIKEAVDYLRTGFKWKKSETSLKFVTLVKRRFLNE